MGTSSNAKALLVTLLVSLLVVIASGLFWFFFLGPQAPVGVGWYLFSFAAGLSMIVLPCTLPLAFVIVPLSMGKGAMKGLGIALSFGFGVSLMLSTYGVLAALLGQVAIGSLGAPLEVVKNWLYFIAGTLAYLFALGELGFINFRMPTYTGAAPAFIQKQQDFIKAFLLGLFLGNIGVGCPHPATPVILTRIAVSGNIFYGWLLFFVHAIGRVLPLLVLSILGILGVDALSWLVARKEKVERATGWGMVIVAAFILVLGLFSHDWWVYSGQHTLLEELTQEEKFLGAIIQRFHFAGAPHVHGMPTGTGLFGLPLGLGNWVLVLLWLFPLWWAYAKRKETAAALPDDEKKIEKALAPVRLENLLIMTFTVVTVFVFLLPERFYVRTLLHDMGHASMTAQMHDEDQSASSAAPSMMHTAGAHTAMTHEEADTHEGLSVNLTTTPASVRTGSATTFDFFVNQKPAGTPVTNLERNHEKLMHVIGVRNDMNEFFHIHPARTDKPGVLTVRHAFAKPGTYKLWSEIQVAGEDHIFGHPSVEATGSGETYKKDVNFASSVIVENHQVALHYTMPLVKNRDEHLTVEVHDAQGQEAQLEPYLGVDMHLTVIRDDLKVFIHTHPEGADHQHTLRLPFIGRVFAHGDEGDSTGEHGIPFSVLFPEAGTYKVFAQFRPKGSALPADEAITASFWIRVEEKTPGISSWWILLGGSLVLIVLLSWATKKYITVDTVPPTPPKEKT